MKVIEGKSYVKTEQDTYMSDNGMTFYKKEDCEHYEDICKKFSERILTHDVWYYISSKEDYELVCEKKSIENSGHCEFSKFDEKYYIGWISFDWMYDSNGPDYFSVTSAKADKEEIDELYAIKNPDNT